jgi:hypothetical protein
MPTNSQLSKHAEYAQFSMQSMECRDTLSETHVLWYKPCSATASSVLDTCRHMQKHGKLGICTFTYMPSICACTCLVPTHADAYSHTLVTHAESYLSHMRELTNMNKTQASLPLHMTMIQMCWHSDLPMYFFVTTCWALYKARAHTIEAY